MATSTTELVVVDSPSGCDQVLRSTLELTDTDAWACWTRAGAGGPQAWCGGRSLAPGATWSTWWEGDLASAAALARVAIFDDAPLVVSRVPATRPDPLMLGWDGTETGALPSAHPKATRPTLASAPDGSLHAAWIEKG